MTKILALDLARVTGFAFGPIHDPERPTALGSVALGTKHGGHGSVGAGLDDWLWARHDAWKFDVLVVEAAIGTHKGQAAAAIALGLAMVTQVFAFRADVQWKKCAVNSVRARVIGSGRARKPEVVSWCHAQGWEIPDHNAADAAVLWVLAKRVYLGKAVFPNE